MILSCYIRTSNFHARIEDTDNGEMARYRTISSWKVWEKENNIFICFDEVGGEMGGGFASDCRELIFIDL